MASNRKRDTAADSNGVGPASATSSANPTPEQTLAFEEALGRLDETVAALESGQLPLQEALALFEEGVRLTQRCQELLDNAELRVQRLRVSASQDAGSGYGDREDKPEFDLEPFDFDDE
jgi:exodeoxyribonuclease VII small subunit